MKAAVWHGPRDVRIAEVDVPTLQEGQVLVEVAYCGICGSDLHEYADGPHAIPVAEPHPGSGATAPLILGHEFCGTVAALGPSVTGLTMGDRVAVEPNYRCGACPRCRAGEYNICRHFGFAGLMGNGGMAEYAAIPAYMAHRLPDSVSLKQAALFEPASVALHALRRAGTTPETVAVVGLGPVGLLTVLLAAERKVPRILAVDVSAARLRRAAGFGATGLIDPGLEGDAGKRIRELTDGEGVDVAFEAVGSETALRTCLGATRRGGRVVLIGLAPKVSLDTFALVNNEQSIISSVGYRDTYPELIRLVAEKRLDLTQVVTSTIGLDALIPSGFEALLKSPGNQVKIIVDPLAHRAEAPLLTPSAGRSEGR
ncbi:butanediol dehydrogenase [Streptomyces pseudovenezuelae]|uniref:Butanediol dehydrogenase n=2 Tax=Streptomyces TaxID=1883 RepID=A0A101N054_9ACTN|nr:butanediol dehydrogenase [Streptomyces pseudovenezuelae]